jgi:hypothetical protein
LPRRAEQRRDDLRHILVAKKPRARSSSSSICWHPNPAASRTAPSAPCRRRATEPRSLNASGLGLDDAFPKQEAGRSSRRRAFEASRA